MIDIIMPCYNAEKYIEETIQSVLRQTEKNFRLICIDDCSKDATYTILQRLADRDKRITVLKNEENCGIAATRNRGIREGQAEYIAFLDDDDIMPPERLKIGKTYLDDHNEVGVVAGNYLIFDENGNKTVVQEKRFYTAEKVRSILPFINIIPNGSTLIKRKIIEKNDIYFHEEYGIEDYRFYAEISNFADIHVLPDVLLEHRVMDTQYSAVCTNSNERFEKRQEAFDRVHKLLINNITDKCDDKDIKIYLRFMQENVKDIRITEVLRLLMALSKMKKAVKRKENADYHVFSRSADCAMLRALKAYIVCKTKKEGKQQ